MSQNVLKLALFTMSQNKLKSELFITNQNELNLTSIYNFIIRQNELKSKCRRFAISMTKDNPWV